MLIFIGLALFCSLGAGSVPHAYSGAQTSSTPTVSVSPTEATPVGPTDINKLADNANSTMTVLQITDYHYFDWPKIGYQIFMHKMVNALKSLKFFMNLDPMLLKITRTFVLTNDTDIGYDDNKSMDENSNEISSTQEDQSMETNTESPLKFVTYGNSEETNGDNDEALYKEQSKENHSKESKQEDVIKTKTETGGFFSSIARVVTGLYHTFTDWF